MFNIDELLKKSQMMIRIDGDEDDKNLLTDNELVKRTIANILKEKIPLDGNLIKKAEAGDLSENEAVEAVKAIAEACRSKANKVMEEYKNSSGAKIPSAYKSSGAQNLYLKIKIYHSMAYCADELAEDGYVPSETVIKIIKSYCTKSGCYVATCVYGSYDCPEVWTLRRFRDNNLKRFWIGRVFIRIYYKTSPKLVNSCGKKKWFNKLFKPILDKMVIKLQNSGVDSSNYYD